MYPRRDEEEVSLSQKKYLLPGERQDLERILEKYKDSDFRNTTLLWTLLRSGARTSEVLGLTPADIYNSFVFIKSLKGGKDREIPVPTWLFDRLRVLCNGLDNDAHVFNIAPRTLRDIWYLYRPVKKRVHSLRHSFALFAYEKKKDLRVVQKALGHRDIKTTMVYADYDYTGEEMREALGL
jgi:integrase